MLYATILQKTLKILFILIAFSKLNWLIMCSMIKVNGKLQLVKFGNEIRLRHRFSGYYLTFDPLKFQLLSSSSNSTSFKFISEPNMNSVFVVCSPEENVIKKTSVFIRDKSSFFLKVKETNTFINIASNDKTIRAQIDPLLISIRKFGKSQNEREEMKIYSGDILGIIDKKTELFLEASIGISFWKDIGNYLNANKLNILELSFFMNEENLKNKFQPDWSQNIFKNLIQNYSSKNLFTISSNIDFLDDAEIEDLEIYKNSPFTLKNTICDNYLKFSKPDNSNIDDCEIFTKIEFLPKNYDDIEIEAFAVEEFLRYNKNLVIAKQSSNPIFDVKSKKSVNEDLSLKRSPLISFQNFYLKSLDENGVPGFEVKEFKHNEIKEVSDFSFTNFSHSEILDILFLKEYRELLIRSRFF